VNDRRPWRDQVKLLIFGIVIVLSGIGLLACRRHGALPAPDAPRAAIWMLRDGTVELDGKPASLDMVDTKLASLAQRKGVVLYGREAASEEPHPNGMKIMQMVVSHRLPIRMSTQRDFSDAVGPDGKLRQ
jgi:hypothetical protein